MTSAKCSSMSAAKHFEGLASLPAHSFAPASQIAATALGHDLAFFDKIHKSCINTRAILPLPKNIRPKNPVNDVFMGFFRIQSIGSKGCFSGLGNLQLTPWPSARKSSPCSLFCLLRCVLSPQSNVGKPQAFNRA